MAGPSVTHKTTGLLKTSVDKPDPQRSIHRLVPTCARIAKFPQTCAQREVPVDNHQLEASKRLSSTAPHVTFHPAHLSTDFVPTLCTVWISRSRQNRPATPRALFFCLLIRVNAKTEEGRGRAARLGKNDRSCGQHVGGVRNKTFRGSNSRGNKQFPNRWPDLAAFHASTVGAAKSRSRVRLTG